jgi:hypothetical protein
VHYAIDATGNFPKNMPNFQDMCEAIVVGWRVIDDPTIFDKSRVREVSTPHYDCVSGASSDILPGFRIGAYDYGYASHPVKVADVMPWGAGGRCHIVNGPCVGRYANLLKRMVDKMTTDRSAGRAMMAPIQDAIGSIRVSRLRSGT